MSFFVFVRSNVARGASSLDLSRCPSSTIIAVSSLDRSNVDIGIRPAGRSSSTTFLHVARPACRPSTSINLGPSSWTRCRGGGGGGGGGAWTFSRRICYAFYRAPGRLPHRLSLSRSVLLLRFSRCRAFSSSLLLSVSLFLSDRRVPSPSAPRLPTPPPVCRAAAHPLVPPPTLLARSRTPVQFSLSPPTARLLYLPHTRFLYLFRDSTEQRNCFAHDETRRSSSVLGFLKSSSRVPILARHSPPVFPTGLAP